MRWRFVVVFAVLSTAPGRAAYRQTTPSTSKSSGAKPAAKPAKTTVSKTPSSAHLASNSATRRRGNVRSSGNRRRGHPAPSYQLHPDPERYQEIQKALAERGYFKGEPNGEWGPDSVDALKRFQADQKLTNDGKINAPSLIGLGLGPKYNSLPVPPAIPPSQLPPAPPPPAPESQPPVPPPPATQPPP